MAAATGGEIPTLLLRQFARPIVSKQAHDTQHRAPLVPVIWIIMIFNKND